MSQNKSLAALFQELGNNPEQLTAFQANPDKFLDNLPEEEQDKLHKISNRLVAKTGKITSEYRGGGRLKDGDPIVPGDFYFGADGGSTIYQAYSTRANLSNTERSFSEGDSSNVGMANRLPVHKWDIQKLNNKDLPQNGSIINNVSNDIASIPGGVEFYAFDPSEDESQISNCFLVKPHYGEQHDHGYIAEMYQLVFFVRQQPIDLSQPYIIKVKFIGEPTNQKGYLLIVASTAPLPIEITGDFISGTFSHTIDTDYPTPDGKGYMFGFRPSSPFTPGLMHNITVKVSNTSNAYTHYFISEEIPR